ncbi:MAG: HTH-type transcriptional repressor CytR [Lentisphaerae bacterium ADurb.Bin242]|nr:MAG: HTH-type transcriptional repressor CytR [Lentisphaerae bacterium ADurb.Bin242]
MAVTINDIARVAKVDKAAVSLTLRDRPEANRLRPETRERIRKAARELGYRRNLIAWSTRTGIVNTLAVIGRFGREDALSYTNWMLFGILTTCTRYGYNIRVYPDDSLDFALGEIAGGRISHVISLSVDSEIRRLTTRFCRDEGIKLLYLFEGACEGFPSLNTDNYAAAREVVRSLAALGHRRIGLLCVPHNYLYVEERHNGYLAGLREAGLKPDPALVDCSDSASPSVERMLSLPKNKRPTAIFGISDAQAVEAERTALRMGLNVPGDLSIFGFGNSDYSRAAYIPVSTVDESPYDCGVLGVNILLGKPVDISMREDGRYLIPPRLIRRESVAPPENSTSGRRERKAVSVPI